MKRIIIIVLGLALLVGLGIFTSRLISKKGKSDEHLAAFNFEIKDTASVNKIIITEPNGVAMTLIRSGKEWTDANGQCVQPVQVFNILDALYNVRFKGYVPENAVRNVINRITTIGIKVEYFQDDEWTKTWYIGGSTSDHHGTYMLVESAEAGKSDLPVIAEIKGMKGIIEPRFFSDPRKWQCSGIFAYQMQEIAEVNVKFPERPDRSFEVRKIKKDYLVKFPGSYTVDASLIGLAVPYQMFSVDDPVFSATIRRIEAALLREGGVHRYPTDTYYGGGAWILLTGWLGWYYVRSGQIEKAKAALAWIEQQADAEGNLPEQVPSGLNDPNYFQPWVERWGPPATPLLWSHANYLILAQEIETAGSGK